ncbi:MAG: DUF1540 domain-containing protein [Planctomycetaceae bacterium]|nr:DUF1540 domain-containing protein [Planctomycetaceae bacterium]
MNMPRVIQCDATDCSFNRERQCHALAVTIGDGDNPQCDTYCHGANKGGDPASIAGVGACKVASCLHNRYLECWAPNINVGMRGGDVDCLTYSKR